MNPNDSHEYNAFVSYSHAVDGKLAPALQAGLQQFAKKWNQVRALRLFRDKTGLSVTPGLWSSIEAKLNASEYFLLLASPEAAQSTWVNREVQDWVNRGRASKLLIILTGGEIVWESEGTDFAWPASTALPEVLRGKFTEEPFYVDLRWARTAEDLTLGNARFRESVADIASTLRGVPKDQLIGEDVRQHKKTVMVRRLLIWASALLAVGLGIAAFSFIRAQRETGEARLRTSEAQREARMKASQGELSLALSALQRQDKAEALARVASALRINSQNAAATSLALSIILKGEWWWPLGEPMTHGAAVRSAAFSNDGQRVLTVSYNSADTTDGAAPASARLWDATSGKPLGEPMKHENAITSAAFSGDGLRVVTASRDGTARLWDAASGKPLGEPMKHPPEVCSAAFSSDGQRVVTASGDQAGLRNATPRTARLWDAATGKPVGEPMQHDNAVWCAAFSSDGRQVLTASEDRTARLWDGTSGKSLGEPMRYENPVRFAAFSNDDQRVVAGSAYGTAQIWDASSRKPVGEPMKHESVTSAAFSGDGQRVVTASRHGTARLWDASTGKSFGEPMKHDSMVTTAAFSSDGQRVVTASVDNTARLWDAGNGRPLCEPVKHKQEVLSAAFSRDDERVVTATVHGTAQIWHAGNGKPLVEPLRHEGPLRAAAFSSDDERVVTTSDVGAVRVWDARTGKPLGEPFEHNEAIWCAAVSDDGRRVILASEDGSARLCDAASGKPLGEPMKHVSAVASAAFSKDGQRVVTVIGGEWVVRRNGDNWAGAAEPGKAQVWDAASGKPLGEPMKHDKPVKAAAFSSDGERVVTVTGGEIAVRRNGNNWAVAMEPRNAQVWDARTGKPLGDPIKHDKGFAAAFSNDGRRAVMISDQDAQLWDITSGKLLGEPMKHNAEVTAAAFSDDGRRVVTASSASVRTWDATNGKLLGEPMKHDKAVKTAALSSDGQRVVTASGNNVRLWDGSTGKPLGEPIKHEKTVSSASFSSDGQRIVTASEDGTARLWDTPVIPDSNYGSAAWNALADLAEAIGGFTLKTSEGAERLDPVSDSFLHETLGRISAAVAGKADTKLTPYERILKWIVSDRGTRTISPFSKLTVPEWIENRIRDGDLEGLRSALFVQPNNPRLLAHLGKALAAKAIAANVDPDEARRARGEADFLTRHALELSPKNEEIQKLRAAVVEALRP